MNAVTTGLAKAKYDPDKHQVYINFNGLSTKEILKETLDIVLEIGLINRVNRWVLNLDHLEGTNANNLIRIVLKWLGNAYDKMVNYGVKQRAEIIIISEPNLRKLTLAVKKAHDSGLIPHWVTLRVYESEIKIYRKPEIAKEPIKIMAIQEKSITW